VSWFDTEQAAYQEFRRPSRMATQARAADDGSIRPLGAECHACLDPSGPQRTISARAGPAPAPANAALDGQAFLERRPARAALARGGGGSRGTRSTLIASQIPVDSWHDHLGDPLSPTPDGHARDACTETRSGVPASDALVRARAFAAALVEAFTARASGDQRAVIAARRAMRQLAPTLFAAYLERQERGGG
jgi:hypothetical protein